MIDAALVIAILWLIPESLGFISILRFSDRFINPKRWDRRLDV